MAPSSFGLKPENKEYILEEMFLLTEYCHVSWTEGWALPITYRKWLIERKKKEMEKQKEAQNKNKTKAAPQPKKPPPKPAKK